MAFSSFCYSASANRQNMATEIFDKQFDKLVLLPEFVNVHFTKKYLNLIIRLESYSLLWNTIYSEEDEEDRQLIDDTYDCFNSLCQTLPGLEAMLKTRSVSTFCEVVISQSYGKTGILLAFPVKIISTKSCWHQCISCITSF